MCERDFAPIGDYHSTTSGRGAADLNWEKYLFEFLFAELYFSHNLPQFVEIFLNIKATQYDDINFRF